MDIYTIGEERCIDGTWGRMVGKRFYDRTTEIAGAPYLARQLDLYGYDIRYVALVETIENRFQHEYILDKEDLYSYAPKPIEHKRGDIVWVFDSNKWQPVYYWDKNTVSADSFVCIKSFTTDGKVKMDDFIHTFEVYSKLPIEIQ